MTDDNGNNESSDRRDLGNVLRECHEKEAFNFALFQHNPSAITVVDREGKVVKSNLARRHAHDSLPELGRVLFSGDSECDIIMKSELKKTLEQNVVREVSDVRSGGHIFAYTLAPFTHGAIVIRQDITEHKRAEAQLVQAQKLAALGTLVSGVAHEVSNPNNVMLLSLKTIRRITDDLLPVLDEHKEKEGDFDLGIGPYSEIREDIPEMVASCYRAAERINRLVSDLKNYARKEDGEVRDLFDVNAVVQGASELMNSTISKATHHFSVTCADDLPPVKGAARRIEQVVINLLSNACQAVPNQDCAISLSTAYNPAANEVHIMVQDEGVGIPPEAVSQITDPFFTTKHDTGGTGLGLSISRQIVETHGGALVFSSAGGRGTLVTIALPVPRGSEEETA
ncbi:MAG: ATP-binding protein [Kiritimatiellia bacterium]|nr:ATP-binding protein [Kiritimatiellia bacterium]MDP6629866.1 ATP-binding protein [Kiritimatiellia bacterium]MDP6809711.1 ATP-binding protein [Kiritimatiellia bacterium]MDP7025179.1 ATP-binding protein [Kiritimatiellia bacterium]